MSDQDTSASVDLSELTPRDTGILHITVPGSNKRTGWQICFAGPGHPKTIAQMNEISRAALDKAEKIEFAQVNQRKWKADGKQPDDVRRENVNWVLGRILYWGPPEGVLIKQFSPDPVALPENATPEQIKRAAALLGEPYMAPYFTQMSDYLGDQASFIEASAKS